MWKDSETPTEELVLREDGDETNSAMTPRSVLSRKSCDRSPVEASRREGRWVKGEKRHQGFFDPRTLNRSVDALQDPHVTVYCSVLNPTSKLRTSTLEKVAVHSPRIDLSPQK